MIGWWIAGVGAGAIGALTTAALPILARRATSMNQDELFLIAPVTTALGAHALARPIAHPALGGVALGLLGVAAILAAFKGWRMWPDGRGLYALSIGAALAGAGTLVV